MARTATEPEITRDYLNMARAYRSQADVLKAKKRSKKEKRRHAPQVP
jgi:hypothetical protein